MSAAWNHFWFAEGNPLHLAMIRVLFFAFLLFVAQKSTIRDWARLYQHDPAFWRPVSFFRLFPPPPTSAAFVRLMKVLVVVWYVAIAWAASGLLFPLGGIAATLMTLYMLGYENQFGKTNHARTLLPVISLILTCAPADPLCFKPLFQITSPEYGYFWPIQLGRVLVSIVWCFAGIAKLRNAGLTWATSNNLPALLKLHVMDYYFVPPKFPAFAAWLCRQDLLCRMAAVGTMILELAFPLGLFYVPLGIAFAAVCMGLIVGFATAQGPLFLPLFTMMFLLWFPYPA